jgi:HAMP domain-containing protein
MEQSKTNAVYTTSSSSREIKNLLIKPHQQLRFLIFIFTCAVASFVAFSAFFMVFLKRAISQLDHSYGFDADVTTSLNDAVNWALTGTVVLGVVVFISFMLAGLIVSHRVFGPQIPLMRLIGDLKAGRYSSRGFLRKHDEFHDLMNSLNELGETLEKRHGSTENKTSVS